MFQFPSNGKVDPKTKSTTIGCKLYRGFNSLQTGKCIQRRTADTRSLLSNYVSIPFKRESGSKVLKGVDLTPEYTDQEFQFPSNGKVYPKLTPSSAGTKRPVSFNSLQTGKCIQRRTFRKFEATTEEFQFPSNGKVYPKANAQFENVSKDGFNSLQTGKCIQSRMAGSSGNTRCGNLFQFPSNGKVYPKALTLKSYCLTFLFQFPSNGKVYPKKKPEPLSYHARLIKFQFPSNGKVYPKRPCFKPSGAVAPYVQNQTRTARGNF